MGTIKDTVRASILNADPKLKETSMDFMHQAILLASIPLGANESEIAEELGFDLEFVETVGARLRNAGIWTKRILDQRHWQMWDDKDGGSVSFLLDAGVAAGDMEFRGWKNGEAFYRLSKAGHKRVEKMLRA
jgi:hypothetical protein